MANYTKRVIKRNREGLLQKLRGGGGDIEGNYTALTTAPCPAMCNSLAYMHCCAMTHYIIVISSRYYAVIFCGLLPLRAVVYYPGTYRGLINFPLRIYNGLLFVTYTWFLISCVLWFVYQYVLWFLISYIRAVAYYPLRIVIYYP